MIDTKAIRECWSKDETNGATIHKLAGCIDNLQTENEKLKCALRVIASPCTEKSTFTSDKAMDEYHQEILIKWLNKNSGWSYKIFGGNFYGLVTDVAEQVLKGGTDG